MKFQSITMNNFMRYKGQNVIEFSCDEKRNVTVVLGDNTVGKTTIAQAFRWVLYGAVLTERGKHGKIVWATRKARPLPCQTPSPGDEFFEEPQRMA